MDCKSREKSYCSNKRFQIICFFITTDYTDFYGFGFDNLGVASSRFVRMGQS